MHGVTDSDCWTRVCTLSMHARSNCFVSMHYSITVTAVVLHKPTVLLVIVNPSFCPKRLSLSANPVLSTCIQVYYQGAVGAFVVFDVTQSKTFEAVQMWKEDVDNKLLLPNGKHIPAVLLANKVTRR